MTAGTRVGSYQLIREIGRGGMGVVYEAMHADLRRRVALKVLPWAGFASEELRERFRREAEAAARLDHTNIIAVYEWGDHAGCPFMTMRLVEGARSLADEIARGPLSPREAVRILAKVARAAHYSHQHGVLHRDIKPGNVLLDHKREPLLVDFGLARVEDAAFQLTHSDLVFGTPSYMSPEQAEGRDVTTASDVYSLGAVLYDAVTGRPPFRGGSVAETMRQLAEQDPVRPRVLRPELDRDIDTIIMKCLEKSPHRRYGSAEAFADDLERWLDHWPIHARPGNVTTRAFKWARRRPGVAGLTTALVFTALIGLSVGWISWLDYRVRDWNALLADARYWRISQQPGRRFEAIASLQRAADIRPSIELQNEAVAALALSDLRAAEVWEGNPDKHPLVALSRDVRLSACPRHDGSILVFEREKLLTTLPGDDTPVNAILRFSADGRWLAAGYAQSGTSPAHVKVWDWRAAKTLMQIDGVSGAALDFWPDGSAVAACVGSELRFYLLPGGGQHRPSVSLPDPAYCVRVSPSGRQVAVSLAGAAFQEENVVVIDLHEGAAAQPPLKNGSAVRMLSWHPRLDWIAAPCGDGSIRILDAGTRTLLQTIKDKDNDDHVMEAVWNPEGDIIASYSADGTLKLWDASTGDLFVRMEHPMGPLVFSDDGTRLGPGLDGTGVRLFEVAPLEICRRLRSPPDGGVWSAAFSHDGGILATTDKKVRLWNKAGYELATLPFVNPRSVLFGKDSMIVTGNDGVVRWPLRTETVGKAARVVLGTPQRLAERGHEWEFAAISSNEKLLAVASPQEVALLSLSEPKPTKYLRGHTGASYVAASHDGAFVATGTKNRDEVWVWNCDTEDVVARLPVRGGACVAFTSEGKWLITGNSEEFRCWDAKTWKQGASHHRHDDMPGTMAVSPRGTAAAIAYKRNRVRVVDISTLTTVCEPECGPHTPLCFSRDGSILVSANTKGNVFMWDVARIRNQLSQLRLEWYFPRLEFSKAPLVKSVELP